MKRSVGVVSGLAAAALLVVAVSAVLRDPPAPPRCSSQTLASAQHQPVNVVWQLRTADDGYELELWTQEPFPVRAMPTLLRIGTIDLGLSRFVEGDLTRIVFPIPSEDYERMATGDPILIHHTLLPPELDANPNLAGNVLSTDGRDLWTFGRLDKSQLDCPPIGIPENNT